MASIISGVKTFIVNESISLTPSIKGIVKYQLKRCFSVKSQCLVQEKTMNIFDRRTKRHQKDLASNLPNHEVYDYLKDEIAGRIADRVMDVPREFPKALDLGCSKGHIGRRLSKDDVGVLYQCDMSQGMLSKCKEIEIPTVNINADEEFLPFSQNSFDLVVSNLSLHWVNDLPGCLRQILGVLKEDSPFIGSIFGGDTLYELRSSLQVAEMEKEGGFAPRVSPFAEMRDVGNLLTRAGFSLITVDYEDLTIHYPSMFELMKDLKGMGENNCAWNRKSVLHRKTQKAAADIYRDYYGLEDGSIPATFHILYMIGWKPSKSQPKPLERGSATVSLKDLDSIIKNPPSKE